MKDEDGESCPVFLPPSALRLPPFRPLSNSKTQQGSPSWRLAGLADGGPDHVADHVQIETTDVARRGRTW